MKVLYPYCGGLDVHKEFVVACILICHEDGKAEKEICRFSTVLATWEVRSKNQDFYPKRMGVKKL